MKSYKWLRIYRFQNPGYLRYIGSNRWKKAFFEWNWADVEARSSLQISVVVRSCLKRPASLQSWSPWRMPGWLGWVGWVGFGWRLKGGMLIPLHDWSNFNNFRNCLVQLYHFTLPLCLETSQFSRRLRPMTWRCQSSRFSKPSSDGVAARTNRTGYV